jgi:hypothetical protein
MRTMQKLFSSLAALALMTSPVLAKNSNTQPPGEKSAASPCHTLQRGPDGAWIEIPCQEVGAPAQTRPAGRGAETAHKAD